MTETIIYCSVLILLLVYGIRTKAGSLFLLLVGEYVVVGIMAVICIQKKYVLYSNVRLWPYFLLLYSYIVCLFPFCARKNKDETRTEIYINNDFANAFAIVYIICSVITVLVYLPYVLELLKNRNWSENRDYMYANDVILTNNIFQSLAVNLTAYLQIPAMIISFDQICKNNSSTLRKILLLSVTACTVVRALYGSSRGILLDYILLMLAVFLFFYKHLPRRKKKQLILLFISASVVALLYAIEVTDSRFSERSEFGDNSSSGSLVWYFGQAPVVFNNIISRAKQPLLGKYEFGKILSTFGFRDPYIQAETGVNWKTYFYTYVGYFYLDWGAFGTLLIIPCIAYSIHRLLQSHSFQLSTLYALFFYCSFLQKGAFVIGRTFSLELLVFLIVYVAMKMFENYEYNYLLCPPSKQCKYFK